MGQRFLFLILFLVLAASGSAQTFLGQREVRNFGKTAYNGGTQNWDIAQDEQHRMYFANNEGLLVYDGTSWRLIPVPNKTILRSIEFGKDKRLYAGAQDEIGYYAPDKSGRLVYHSLNELLPPGEQKFSDVWDIVSYGDAVFFRTNYKIFRLRQNKITLHPPISTWISLRMHQGRLIAHDEKTGLLVFENESWKPLIDKKTLPAGFFITSTLPFGKDTSLLATARNGLFLLSGQTLTPFFLKGQGLDNNQHFSAIAPAGPDKFIAGTYTNGCYEFNRDGSVTANFSRKDGLQNNNIRSIYTDKSFNSWLGLDNGIDFITNNTSIQHINPLTFNDGGGYAVSLYKNKLHFALSSGIFSMALPGSDDLTYTPNTLQPVAGGQTWQLSITHDKLLAGRDDGVFLVNENGLTPVATTTGFWIFKELPNSMPPVMVAGNYYGVSLFEQTSQSYTEKGLIKNFGESARFLAIDRQLLWVSHPYRGVYKINLADSSVRLYTKEQGLPSTLNNHVFKIKGRVLTGTEKGIYEYDTHTNRFMPSPVYSSLFGEMSIRYLQEDPSGNIWFVHEKTTGVADYTNPDKPALIYIPELKNRILSGFENVYTINSRNIFVGAEKGFYHINYEQYKKNIRPFQVYISAVKLFGKTDSTIYGGYATGETEKPAVPYRLNSFRFAFSAPLYEQHDNLEYSYLLEGFEKEWSTWSKRTEKDYTNLPPGDYTFRIKARSHINNESAEARFGFSVRPPWYRTLWAYAAYALALIFLMFRLLKFQEKKHHKRQEEKLKADREKYEEEQRRTVYQHQLELEKSEKEIIRIENEKLEAAIEHKNAELASTAMNLVQKKEFILKLKQELEHLYKAGKDTIQTQELKKMQRILSDEEKLNDEWEQFAVHFNSVHGDFLNILKEKYPGLKPHELKLCAYLRMNLSSKEIAQLMSISLRGVEISRYRLRKKLQIPTEVNLFQFLFDIK